MYKVLYIFIFILLSKIYQLLFQTGSPAKRDACSLPAAHLCYEMHWDTENNSSSSETPGGLLAVLRKNTVMFCRFLLLFNILKVLEVISETLTKSDIPLFPLSNRNVI